ncbi:MAG: gamma-glutamylcyclotransferase [Oceanospirillaceae bacterium]
MSKSAYNSAANALKFQLQANDMSPSVHLDAKLPTLPEGDLWVFGYGSLMWRPGFDFIEQLDGKIYGYHRALCVLSWVYRGTSDNPGLVLGLDKGGSCSGKLFKISADEKQQVANYLFDRELPTMVYNARFSIIHTKDGQKINALTFVVDTEHPQYIKNQSLEQLAYIVAHAQGLYGTSRDYLLSTLEHLRQDGIHDTHLEGVAAFL